MEKASQAFRTISEVAKELGVQKHVLRFWETKFPQIKPMKRGGGRRYYRPEELVLLRGIQVLLHVEGYTIRGVQKILRDGGVNAVKDYGDRPQAPPARTGTKAANGKSSTRQRDGARSASTLRVPAAARSENPATAKSVNSQTPASIAHVISELQDCRDLLARKIGKPLSRSAKPRARKLRSAGSA